MASTHSNTHSKNISIVANYNVTSKLSINQLVTLHFVYYNIYNEIHSILCLFYLILG